MKILLTGATGQIGQHVAHRLVQEGHELVILTRSPEIARKKLRLTCEAYSWAPHTPQLIPSGAFHGAQAVIHLAGESLTKGRWNKNKKEMIYQSRVLSTQRLIEKISAMKGKKPEVFICASATAIYGDRGDELLTETSALSSDFTDFFSKVCQDWEKESLQHSLTRMRSVTLRLGTVLSPSTQTELDAKALRVSEEQWISWVHVDDVVGAILLALRNRDVRGPMNVTAPESEKSRVFSKTFKNTFHRTLISKMPLPLLRIALGEKFEFFLASQRALPERLLKLGYVFRFPTLASALENLKSARGT